MNEEIWKDIEGYEGLYQISNWGRVRNAKTLNIKKRTHREINRICAYVHVQTRRQVTQKNICTSYGS